MGVAEDQDDEERQRGILQQAGNMARAEHESETAFQATKGRRAELLREEMQRWHVGQQMGEESGGGGGGGGVDRGDTQGGEDETQHEVSDARRRYLENVRREALELAQKSEQRHKVQRGGQREAGDPYKMPPPQQQPVGLARKSKKKKKKKKGQEGAGMGRKTVFG